MRARSSAPRTPVRCRDYLRGDCSVSSLSRTAINKLDVYLKRRSLKREVFDRLTVIFDECHRSQFGEMHKAITRHFKNYHLFGFTGTPIFTQNTGAGAEQSCAPPHRPSVTACTPTPR